MYVQVEVCDPGSGTLLYRRLFSGGILGVSSLGNLDGVYCETTQKYASLDSVMRNVGEAIQDIERCQKKIAARIAADLR
jgi:hypothetical protein